MIALFLYVILAISLAAAGGYAVFSVIRSNDTLTLAQRNQAIMQNVAQVVRSNVIREGDFLLAPAPEGSFVPAWIAEFAKTPWGADYRYCAFTTMAGGGSEAVHPGYSIESEARTPLYRQDLQDFVVGQTVDETDGPFSGAGAGYSFPLVAAIVSPAVNSAEPALCSEISYDVDGFWSVPAGSIVAITEDMFPIGGVASGTRSEMLRTVTDDEELEPAMEAWQANDYRPAIFRFAGDEITLNQSDFNAAPSFYSRTARLTLIGPSNTNRAELVGTVSIPLRTDTTIRFVDFGPNVTLIAYPGVTVTIENSTVTNLSSQGATLQAGRDVHFLNAGAATSPFVFMGGRFEILRSNDDEIGPLFRVSVGASATSALSMANGDIHIAQNVQVAGAGITAATWLAKSGAVRLKTSPTIAGIPADPTLTINGGVATEIEDSPGEPETALASDNTCMVIDTVTYGCESICEAPATLQTGGCVGSAAANLITAGPNPEGDGWFCSWAVADANLPPPLSSNALCVTAD